MKDFRAYNGSNSSDPQGPSFGGSAFSLPNIPFIGSISALCMGSLFYFLNPWRFIRGLPMRRRGMIGAFFSWGRLATLALALMLLLSPSTLQQNFPEWRTLAYVCFFVSALSVVGAISRCCGSALSCAFWVALTLFMGEKAFRPGQLSGILDNRVSWKMPTLVSEDTPVLIEEGQWEDMVTGEPVTAREVSYAIAPRVHRAVAPSLRPRSAVRRASPAMVSEAGIFDGLSQGFSSQLNSLVPDMGLGAVTGSSWRDGAALPESAYFGGGAKVGAVGSAFGNSSDSPLGGGLDGIIGQVSSLLKK